MYRPDLNYFQSECCLFVILCCRGLFITIHDRGHIASLLQNWPEKDIKVYYTSYHSNCGIISQMSVLPRTEPLDLILHH